MAMPEHCAISILPRNPTIRDGGLAPPKGIVSLPPGLSVKGDLRMTACDLWDAIIPDDFKESHITCDTFHGSIDD
jgi:hypothetical protein